LQHHAAQRGLLAVPLSSSTEHVKRELDRQGAGQVDRQYSGDVANNPIWFAWVRGYVRRLGNRLREPSQVQPVGLSRRPRGLIDRLQSIGESWLNYELTRPQASGVKLAIAPPAGDTNKREPASKLIDHPLGDGQTPKDADGWPRRTRFDHDAVFIRPRCRGIQSEHSITPALGKAEIPALED
jgi:hypothetical protein